MKVQWLMIFQNVSFSIPSKALMKLSLNFVSQKCKKTMRFFLAISTHRERLTRCLFITGLHPTVLSKDPVKRQLADKTCRVVVSVPNWVVKNWTQLCCRGKGLT